MVVYIVIAAVVLNNVFAVLHCISTVERMMYHVVMRFYFHIYIYIYCIFDVIKNGIVSKKYCAFSEELLNRA